MAITAPYNFVPLAKQVFFPDEEWVESISHDIPFEEGVSGVLSLKITAHTPLLIGNEQTKNEQGSTVVQPFKLPRQNGQEGKYAIPGASLKGMIRNVVEIASFGKMQGVDDKRYSVRDLSKGATFYRDLANKSQSGWLKYDKGQWEITSCNFISVKQSDLFNYHSNSKTLDTPLNKEEKASGKYTSWKKVHADTRISFDIEKGKNKFYASNLGEGGNEGNIVFTGQVDNKKIEFIFYNQKESFPVSQNIINNFFFVHRDQQNSDHWDYLEQFKLSGLPVFYIKEKGRSLHSIGLSKMYKVAYNNSIHEAIENTSKDHLKEAQQDLAEIIFGYTDDDNIEKGLKGRVNFSLAICEQDKLDLMTKETILNNPKPTYYPNYIKQIEDDGNLVGNYKTLMDQDAELRGWKRYPVKNEVSVSIPEDDQSAKVRSIITALSSENKLTFKGKVRFHNLKPVELGAIIWAITWGDNSNLRHAIGMGKSFGYGQISLEINPKESQLLPNNRESTDTLDSSLNAYQELMDATVENWSISEQLFQLKKMADPSEAPGDVGALEHMALDDYLDNKNDKQVLVPYAYQAPPMTPERWLELNINFMSQQQGIDNPDRLYFQKGLLNKWLALSDSELKKGIRELIKKQWNKLKGKDDFWDNPIKKLIPIREEYGCYQLKKPDPFLNQSVSLITVLGSNESDIISYSSENTQDEILGLSKLKVSIKEIKKDKWVVVGGQNSDWLEFLLALNDEFLEIEAVLDLDDIQVQQNNLTPIIEHAKRILGIECEFILIPTEKAEINLLLDAIR